MTVIKYTGPSDYQGFGPGDFMKVGVEVEEALVFIPGRPTEVPEDVARVLTEGEGVFAGFKFEHTDEEAWVEPEPDEEPEEIEGEEDNPEGEPLDPDQLQLLEGEGGDDDNTGE